MCHHQNFVLYSTVLKYCVADQYNILSECLFQFQVQLVFCVNMINSSLLSTVHDLLCRQALKCSHIIEVCMLHILLNTTACSLYRVF